MIRDDLRPLPPVGRGFLAEVIGRTRGLIDRDCEGEADPGTLGDLAVSSARVEGAAAKRRAKMERRAHRAGFLRPVQGADVDDRGVAGAAPVG